MSEGYELRRYSQFPRSSLIVDWTWSQLEATVADVKEALARTEKLSAELTEEWSGSLNALMQELLPEVGEDGAAVVRDAAERLIGPRPRPELVQEAALSALLDLEPLLRARGELRGGGTGG